MSALNCDTQQPAIKAGDTSEFSAQNSGILSENYSAQSADQNKLSKETQEFTFHFPNIFDVFRSLF